MFRTKTGVAYAIPFNGDMRLMAAAVETGKVAEIYFAGSKESLAALRSYGQTRVRNESNDRRVVQTLINLCRKNNVKSNLLCNQSSFFFSDLERIFAYIHSLKNLDSVTIADPLYAHLFVKEFPHLDIQASLVMGLDNAYKMRRMLQLGIGTVTTPGDVNRNEDTLKEFKKLKKEFPKFRLKLMANNVCAFGCPFFNWHYDWSLYLALTGRETRTTKYGAVCGSQSCRVPFGSLADLLRRPFIRPEDVELYLERGYADVFKLAYRTYDTPRLERILKAYFSCAYEGNLWDLIPLQKNYPQKIYCDNTKFPANFAALSMKPRTCSAGTKFYENIAAKVMV